MAESFDMASYVCVDLGARYKAEASIDPQVLRDERRPTEEPTWRNWHGLSRDVADGEKTVDATYRTGQACIFET
jgi:hypothetical protein